MNFTKLCKKSILLVVALTSVLGVNFANAGDWDYLEKKDEMRGVVNKWASLMSENTVPLSFPYNPGAKLAIIVRSMPKQYGLDVMLTASKGQLTCSYRNCFFSVKFDDNKVQKITAVKPESGSSDTLFVANNKTAQALIKKLKSAKKIYIETDFFRDGPAQFVFEPQHQLKWNNN
ncbi:MAG: hypothetical protein PHN76_05920 [Advenella sp.]|uniref:hypothetical protein n=1 Tax=Advenella sp. TaxID=1872388 RepID=UPI002585A1BA|nr:hypothetical protein [Advenella sp.]MDD3757683.1 hypothetical protein [Advenella sp.]